MDFGDLLDFGGKIIGGVMNKSAMNKQRDQIDALNRNKIQWTVEDAKKAGIHPLAALGSPVAGSFASPVANTALGDAVADGAASLGRSFSKSGSLEIENAQLTNERLRAEIELTRAQSRTLTARTMNELRGVDVAGNKLETPGGLAVGGRVLQTNPNFSDAQRWQDRGGDIVENVMGLAAMMADIYQTMKPSVQARSDNFERRRERWHSGR